MPRSMTVGEELIHNRKVLAMCHEAEREWRAARNRWLARYGVSDEHAHGCCRNTVTTINDLPTCEYRENGYYQILCPRPAKYLAVEDKLGRRKSVTFVCGEHGLDAERWTYPCRLIRLDSLPE